MPYDPELADRLRFLLAAEGVTEKRMFGGLAFLVGGHLTVAASRRGGLLARLDPREAEALLAEPEVEAVEMGGRGPMRGWLHVRRDALDDDETLRAWVARALAYARSLPPT